MARRLSTFLAVVVVLAAAPPRAAADPRGWLSAELKRISGGNGVPGWRPEQRPTREVACTVDRQYRLLNNVRWGFGEGATPERWRPRFQSTAIPAGQVKEAYLLVEPFKPEWLASHIMLGFRFKDGRELVAADGRTSKGLCVSAEAQVKQGDSYGLVAGMKRRYGMVHVLSTWEDVHQRVNGREQQRLIRYKLNLSQSQRDQLLANAIDRATHPVAGDRYHTLKNSCYTEALSLINSVVPRRQQVKRWWIPRMLRNPLASWPKAGPWALSRKGLLDRSSRRVSRPAASPHR